MEAIRRVIKKKIQSLLDKLNINFTTKNYLESFCSLYPNDSQKLTPPMATFKCCQVLTSLTCVQWWANIIKWTWTNIWIFLDATWCTERISKYIQMQHIYQTNIKIYSYAANSTNTNTNNIQGSFYLKIQIFVLITDLRNFCKRAHS